MFIKCPAYSRMQGTNVTQASSFAHMHSGSCIKSTLVSECKCSSLQLVLPPQIEEVRRFWISNWWLSRLCSSTLHAMNILLSMLQSQGHYSQRLMAIQKAMLQCAGEGEDPKACWDEQRSLCSVRWLTPCGSQSGWRAEKEEWHARLERKAQKSSERHCEAFRASPTPLLWAEGFPNAAYGLACAT